MSDTILVSGATGTIGSRVLNELRRRGASVKPISRNPRQVEAWRREGIEGAVADLANLGDALEGCSQMFLLSPGGPGQFAQDRAAIAAVRTSGIKRLVKISAADANPGSPCNWAAAHGMSDDYLEASGIDYAILRCNAYMSNINWFAKPIQKGFLPHAAGKGASGWIDPHDIARCAVAALLDRPEKTMYYLTGPELLNFDAVAGLLSQYLKRRIRPISLSAPLYYALLRASGLSKFYAKGLTAQYAIVIKKGEEDPGVSNDVRWLTGREPTSYLQYLEANGGPQDQGFSS